MRQHFLKSIFTSLAPPGILRLINLYLHRQFTDYLTKVKYLFVINKLKWAISCQKSGLLLVDSVGYSSIQNIKTFNFRFLFSKNAKIKYFCIYFRIYLFVIFLTDNFCNIQYSKVLFYVINGMVKFIGSQLYNDIVNFFSF